MKKLFLAITALCLTTGLMAQKKANDVAKFKSETIDLGKIQQESPSTATFEVTNISNEPLIIEEATPTCGCTIGDYTKEPIAPGKSGFIKATYNAKNLHAFEKTLSVKFAGVDEKKSIVIKGEVLNKEDYAKLGTTGETKSDKLLTPGTKIKPAQKVPVKKVQSTKTKTTTTTIKKG